MVVVFPGVFVGCAVVGCVEVGKVRRNVVPSVVDMNGQSFLPRGHLDVGGTG